MAQTITEKIFSRTAATGAPVYAGQEVEVKPDFVLAYDFPGYLDVWFKQMRDDFGTDRVREPERFGIFIDHMVPAITPEEDTVHQITRDWCAKNNVELFEREGIGHQVAAEKGYAPPGGLIVHFDGHISQLGAYGALGIGIHKQLLEAFVRDHISFKVPKSTRVNFHGTLGRGVMARDLFHHLLRQLGPEACRFEVLELGGDGAAHLSTESRQTVAGLAMFTGALSAIFEPDDQMLKAALPKARLALDPVYSDPDANYSSVHNIDMSEVKPLIVEPPSPRFVRDIEDFLGLHLDVGYIGSCASGRLDDLRVAARILKDKKIRPGFHLNIVPTSQKIMSAAAEEGLISTLVDAGAFISSSSCDYCFGRIATMNKGQRAVSTGTLNVRGRMGSPDSEIYLCSAATVAASAIEGRVADPREYL